MMNPISMLSLFSLQILALFGQIKHRYGFHQFPGLSPLALEEEKHVSIILHEIRC
jgi:hypothetical protein